jgi:hypothetical protein
MFKKILRILSIVVFAALIVIQFVRIDRTNPSIVKGETLESAVLVPPDIALIIGRSCNDCHSHNTIYPWYSNAQPFAWFLKNHVDDGRRHLNFSLFNTYPPKRKVKKLEEICEQLESKEMPLPSYLWIHRDSVLSEGDSKALCDWANAEKAKFAE